MARRRRTDENGPHAGSRRYLLSIDPGLTATGVAFWWSDEWEEKCPPFQVGSFSSSKGDWLTRALHIYSQIYSTTCGLGVGIQGKACVGICCEMPFYHNTTAGQMVAGAGSLTKLAHLVGLFQALAHLHSCPFYPVQVRDWKGQLPKEVCASRIRSKLGDHVTEGLNEHEIDAIGIGLYEKGFF